MMNKVFYTVVLFLALTIVITGCESNAARKELAFEQHSDWNEYDKKMISEGMIRKDMTKEQVQAAWGKHCDTCLGSKVYQTGVESWEYKTQVVFFNKQGRVTHWVER